MSFCLPILPSNTPKSTLDSEYVEIKMPGCDECEEIMTGAISKFKGVEKCVKDVENQKITVSGSFNQGKLLRKLSSKTGKEVEIIMNGEKSAESETVGECHGECHGECKVDSEKKVNLETLLRKDEIAGMVSEDDGMRPGENDSKEEKITELSSDERKNIEKRMLLSDENPNIKCVIS